VTFYQTPPAAIATLKTSTPNRARDEKQLPAPIFSGLTSRNAINTIAVSVHVDIKRCCIQTPTAASGCELLTPNHANSTSLSTAISPATQRGSPPGKPDSPAKFSVIAVSHTGDRHG